jgi:hypothetical protein
MQISLHPYSNANLKKTDFKATLYDAIEIPWGYSTHYLANFRTTPFHTKSAEEDTLMSFWEAI